MSESELFTAAMFAARRIFYSDVSSTAAFDHSQREQRRIAREIDQALKPEREALKLAEEALQLEIDRYLAEGEEPIRGESRRIRLAKHALLAINNLKADR